jgi:Ca2+-binding EF-hand superfamily protein
VTLDNLRQVFEDADQDKSGYLDASEVTAFLHSEIPVCRLWKLTLKKISLYQVKTCLGRLNMPNSDETVKVLMKQLDPDESG